MGTESSMGPGVRRLVVVVDLEAYSTWSHPVQIGLQHRLEAVVRAGLAGAGLRRRKVDVQDRGDGQLLLLPPGIDEARAVPGLLRALLQALEDDAARRGVDPPLRMRVAMGQGVLHQAATGFVGRAVVDACRMVDADLVRAELSAVGDADLCLIVSDDLYRDVIVQGYGGVPGDGFRRVVVPSKCAEGLQAWLLAMDVSALEPDPAGVGAAAVGGALPLGAAVYAARGSSDETTGDGWPVEEEATDPSDTDLLDEDPPEPDPEDSDDDDQDGSP